MLRKMAWAPLLAGLIVATGQGQVTDDLMFIHHSVGSNWLSSGLESSLIAKTYIDERNDIGYGTAMSPDAGRPTALGSVPGDSTDMNHWIFWFNDYLGRVKVYGCATGVNRIVMFKSCYPNSNITADGTLPGDPFSSTKTLTNYKAIFRHANGPGNTYTRSGYTYQPLEDVFAANPSTLFVYVTAPALCYTGTNDANAHRVRLFNNWLKNEWLASYNAAHPKLNNVLVFDLFDCLAYPDTDPAHPNRLRGEYGGATSDSHPNTAGSQHATQLFATNPDNALDAAWRAFLPGDINLDSHVDLVDLLRLAASWGKATGEPEFDAGSDVDNNGYVDVVDLLILAEDWGR